MIRVYVAGPITKGNTQHNIHAAIKAGDALMAAGFCPFVPHVDCLWDIVSPHTYEEWCDRDNEWLLQCQAVLRIPGESVGADAEVGLAQRSDIPVFYDIDELIKHFESYKSV